MDGQAAAEALRDLIPHTRGRSPLYERLLAGLAGAAERGFDGGAVARLLTPTEPVRAFEPQQLLLAALHHAALVDPGLPHAAWYPTAAGDDARAADDGAVAALVLAYLIEHEAAVGRFVTIHRVQTNEVRRCAALLPGFLTAAGFGLPLRLLELGTAAGLHLRFDRYRVRYAGGPSWGPSGGPELDSRAEGRVPRSLAPPSVEVAERRGVDLNPLDVGDPADVRLLTSFVWPDERDRHQRLSEAVAVAQATPAAIDRGDLVAWVGEHGQPRAGVTTVLFHSSVVHHLPGPAAVAALTDVVDRALRAGTPDAPVVYLAFETPRGLPADPASWPELTVAVGDGDGPPRWRSVLSADVHARWVRWF